MIDKETAKYERLRLAMVKKQLEGRGIRDPRVLDAMRQVPRHLFVSEALQDQTYGDYPLPIGEGQTISQPHIVAEMTQSLKLHSDDRVLELGTGSGYQAAILSRIVAKVYTIERIRSLFQNARRLFDRLQYHNIVTRYSDGTSGWKEEAPFDAIMVTAGAREIPAPIIDQLAMGGRLVAPVGGRHAQELLVLTKTPDGVQIENLGGCRFVKLIGEHGGWRE
ncbi:MAG: protein-L-isoaspartate O-methyltransferase [Deltaproteobacteria bacterium]|nr:MAG: protein-L-isoaspartate O-methyltransferase [Deltaproteobacteria bacterium]